MSMKPLTKKELNEFFQAYRDAFPDWEADTPHSLFRSCGPITQTIGFENLSYGAYRPTCAVIVSGPPDGGSAILVQMLDVKHRQVERRQHQSKWPEILHAMEDQFAPDVRRPLDMADLLRLAEERNAADNINLRHLIGMATLNVHAGRDVEGLKYCERAESSFQEFGSAGLQASWMVTQIAFARELRKAIQEGCARAVLSSISDR